MAYVRSEAKIPRHRAPLTWQTNPYQILDFVDTVFIVVRRKWRQLSFLHVYHHSSIFMVCRRQDQGNRAASA